jgi:hypothetical protein
MRVALARVNALPMFHIRGGGPEQGGVVAEVAEPSVASRTKQGSQHVGLVAMIDRQFLVGLFSADRTEAVLPRRHRVVVFERESVFPPKPPAAPLLRGRVGRVVTPAARVDFPPVCLGPPARVSADSLPIVRVGCVLFLVPAHVRRPSVLLCSGMRPSWRSSAW